MSLADIPCISGIERVFWFLDRAFHVWSVSFAYRVGLSHIECLLLIEHVSCVLTMSLTFEPYLSRIGHVHHILTVSLAYRPCSSPIDYVFHEQSMSFMYTPCLSDIFCVFHIRTAFFIYRMSFAYRPFFVSLIERASRI